MPPPIVCMKPWTDEAVPATWPSGSMAIELKFEPIQPNCNIAAANSDDEQRRAASARQRQAAARIVLTARKPISAPCDSRRMPKRPTSCELRKDDTAIMPATPAKITGNQTPRP